MIDHLAHLKDPRLRDLDAVLQRAALQGIRKIYNAGVDPLHPRAVFEIVPEIDVINCTGIHPGFISVSRIEEQLQQFQKDLSSGDYGAVGELGLDKFSSTSAETQERVLLRQLEISLGSNLPHIFHIVRRHGRFLEILRSFKQPPEGWIHGFTGSYEIATQYIDLGLKLSFGPRLILPESRRLQELIRRLPKDAVVFESDAPDGSLREARAQKVYEPAIIRELRMYAAELFQNAQ